MFFLTTLMAACALGAQAVPVTPPPASTIYVPHILSPNATTVWTPGQKVNITWDASDAPAVINNEGLAVLGHGAPCETLAENFDLRKGWVEITVPRVDPAKDYTITLFGNSSNISEEFTIKFGRWHPW
ncbi:hypothetical protein K525DRAFT_202337 [Schizophyllum commune Loenen D]|nr:hypothetical protein K525DRAFT_202337 [Schizophyllum commune Loenen D]